MAERCGLFLEDLDEGRTDDLPLLFGIDDAGEPVEKQLRPIDEDERQLQPLEAFPDLRGFVKPQHAVVDEDAGEFLANGAVNQQRGDRRIDAAAQRAHDAALACLRPDFRRRLFHERRHRPVARAAADTVGEVPEDLEAPLGVDDFRMEEKPVKPAARIRHRGNRRVRARRDDGKAIGHCGDQIAMTGPHADFRRNVRKQGRRGALPGHAHGRVPELALRRRRHLAPQRMRHQLHAVADAEHRRPRVEERRIAPGCASIGHALRPARQDDPDRTSRANLGGRRVWRPDLRVNRQFAEAPRDQLGVLGSAIENEDGLVSHGNGDLP